MAELTELATLLCSPRFSPGVAGVQDGAGGLHVVDGPREGAGDVRDAAAAQHVRGAARQRDGRPADALQLRHGPPAAPVALEGLFGRGRDDTDTSGVLTTAKAGLALRHLASGHLAKVPSGHQMSGINLLQQGETKKARKI